jgi:small-conductance mechanosensitive channel
MAKELLAAQQEAAKLRAAATAAEQELEMVAARISTLRDSIKIEQARLETAQQQSANSQKAYKSARDYAQKLISTGAAADNINTALNRVDDAEARMAAAEKEVELREEGLEILQSELTELQAEHGASLREAERKRTEAAKANEEVKRLQNPYSLFRIMQWVIDHGPAILGILVGMFVLLWVIKVTEHRIVHLIAGRSDTGTESERESRAKTLASVFRNVSSTAIVVGGVLMLLSEVDINIVPLLGAAGVVGLAVAFGAQSLIKDYFSGFIILLENQYAINDVVKIGDTAGMVEHISLRMTLLRDVEGNAHFIPHGEIKSVTNMTHGWSRAVFDIGVAYKEQVDKVMKVLMELAREIRRDPAFSPLILDDPEMLGVDKLDDSAVVIRFLIKTRPLRQWTIRSGPASLRYAVLRREGGGMRGPGTGIRGPGGRAEGMRGGAVSGRRSVAAG